MRNGIEGNPIRQPKNLVQETVRAGIAQFDFKNGFTFSSGLVSPIYVDGRAVTAHPLLWKLFVKSLSRYARDVDVVAGVATGAIPHSAAVATRLALPHTFVRKEAKTYGAGHRVEGAPVSGRNVLLIEDTVTTGQSMVSAVSALKEAGAKDVRCVSLFEYQLASTKRVISEAGVIYTGLVPVRALVDEAYRSGVISRGQYDAIVLWLRDAGSYK